MRRDVDIFTFVRSLSINKNYNTNINIYKMKKVFQNFMFAHLTSE